MTKITSPHGDEITRTCPYCGETLRLGNYQDSAWLDCDNCLFSAPISNDGTDFGAYRLFRRTYPQLRLPKFVLSNRFCLSFRG